MENSRTSGSSSSSEWNPTLSQETLDTVREIAVSPLIAGFFQGFFSVAMRYRRERKAARKAAEKGITHV